MAQGVNAAAREFDNLRAALERLATAVLAQATALETATAQFDRSELAAIVGRDAEIDALELGLDQMARTFMELRAPLGPDFRFVLAALDIARNLERIGDCIEYVARHVAEAETMPKAFPAGWDRILQMTGKCRELLAMAYQSWGTADARIAASVPGADDQVDELQAEVRNLAIAAVRAGEVDVEVGLKAVLIANKLESIADIASHIAEAVVFVIQARQIRHGQR